MNTKPLISWEDFEKIDIRIGTILDAKPFENARNPSIQLTIDFGASLGIKKSSAQITQLYTPEKLIGKQVSAVVNFPRKQIANFMSDCLVLGVVAENKEIILLTSDLPSLNGLPIG